MKKGIVLLLSFMLIFVLAACTNSAGQTQPSDEKEESVKSSISEETAESEQQTAS